MNWFEEHMLGLMLTLLIVIVVLVIIVLRRAHNARVDIECPAPVTPEMVREKLEKINLDLDTPPSDEHEAKP